jgi:hypothetical protein
MPVAAATTTRTASASVCVLRGTGLDGRSETRSACRPPAPPLSAARVAELIHQIEATAASGLDHVPRSSTARRNLPPVLSRRQQERPRRPPQRLLIPPPANRQAPTYLGATYLPGCRPLDHRVICFLLLTPSAAVEVSAGQLPRVGLFELAHRFDHL